MSLSHFSILLKPSFAFAQGHTVRADAHETLEDVERFTRAGKEVFRVPRIYVHTITQHESHKAAEDHLRRFREARAGAGAASAHITETGVAPRVHRGAKRTGARGSVAEALTLQVKES